MCGSLRRASNSAAVLRTLKDNLAPDIDMTVIPIDDVPLYNEDIDVGEGPAPVAALRRTIKDAHALLLVTPEYNHSIPGVLKNALDWASRPTPGSLYRKAVKPITVASSLLGGVRCQAAIHETIIGALGHIVGGKQVVVGSVGSKVKDGRLVHQDTLDFALAAIDALLDEALRDKSLPPRLVPDEWRRKVALKRPE
jgi:chromate reductase